MRGRRPVLTLSTEGGYPFASGGVSAWCDQLVRSVPDLDVRIVALTPTASPALVYRPPAHVLAVDTIPLWSFTDAARPPRGRSRILFRDAFAALLVSFLDPRADPRNFGDALRDLHRYAGAHDLVAALGSDDCVALLADLWHRFPPGRGDPGVAAPVRPAVGDAAVVATWLEHMLRPLAHPAPAGDIVHCASNGLAGLIALTAAWTHGTPIVLSEHGVYLRERYLAHRETQYGWPVKWALLRFTAALTQTVYAHTDVIAPGNVYNRRWQVRGGADAAAIRTIYNGVDPGEYPLAPPEPQEPTLVYVGRIDPLKDLETLIRAFARVHRAMPHARLRMFGVPAPTRAEYLERCRRLVRELGLEGLATFEGRAPTAQDAYAQGQVVVLSSISEGFPYTVLEAMSSGRATVSTGVGGVPEAVGDAGLVVPPRDPEAFARACLRLLRDARLRARTGAAARRRVLDMFTLEQSMQGFRTVYAGLLGEDRGSEDARAIEVSA